MQSGGNQILSHMMWNKIELQKLTRDREDCRQKNIIEMNSGIEMMLSQNWVCRRPSESNIKSIFIILWYQNHRC